MKKIQMRNWKKYTLEFLSIFVAVISAFTLNNWNDNRNDRNAENKILTEINNGLEKDIADIKLNESGHKTGVRAVRYFRNMIAGKPVAKDSVMTHYLSLTRDFVSIQNVSGYETLKSRGLELIENDSLRTKIVLLYEYYYNVLRKLEEEYYELQFQENYFKEINSSIAPNFEFDTGKRITGIITPLELEPDREKVLLSYLWKMEKNRSFILQYYTEVQTKIEQLSAEIKIELGE
ncbi:hypothetical protein [Sinomicrobium oceani]|uniref:hypothetical protein n=1 Tax=Sinomicrobium oceani TaxID=1150368 RepID=UPI00227BB727|nr:hypothetical protein [Sinomicrobium oceani]